MAQFSGDLRRSATGTETDSIWKTGCGFRNHLSIPRWSKESWVLDALDSAKSLGLAAVVWFEVNKEIDWRLETNVSEALRATINHENPSTPWASSLLGR
jgi:hypothetical protein